MKSSTPILSILAATVLMTVLPACGSLGPGKTKQVHKSPDVEADAIHIEPGDEIITYRDYANPPAPKAPAPKAMSAPAPVAKSYGNGLLEAHLYVPTGSRSTSALHLLKIVPAEVNAGEAFDIKFIVTNLSDLSLDNVLISDPLPTGFKVSKTDPSFPASAISKGEWMVGTLGPKQQKTITITGTAGAGAGSLASCADVEYDTSICLATNVVQPALKLTAKGPAEVSLCDDICIDYMVVNSGTGNANNVMVTGTFPAGLTDKSGRTTLNQNVGTLAAGQSKNFSVCLKGSKTGAFSNSAVAKANGGLTANSNVVNTTIRQAKLSIALDCTQNAYLGRNGRFELTVANTGNATATGAVAEAVVPSNMHFVSATNGGRLSGGKVTWALGNMAAGAKQTMSYTAEARTAGTATSTATLNAGCADSVSATCQTRISGIPALLVEVVDERDPVLVGETETYTITVTNQGSAAGTNINVMCNLPDGQAYVSATGNTAGSASGQTVKFAPVSSLAPKATATWKVVVRATKAANVRFKVTVTSTELGSRPVEETEATTLYE